MASRRKTRKVVVGDKLHGFVGLGGDSPVALQTMTSTYTYDIDTTVAQINTPLDEIPADHNMWAFRQVGAVG